METKNCRLLCWTVSGGKKLALVQFVAEAVDHKGPALGSTVGN